MPRSGAGRRVPSSLEFAAAALAGALHSLPFTFTEAWWLQLLLVAGLAWRVRAATPARAAAMGFGFGTAWLCAGTWWLFISMHRYGGLPAPLAAAAVFALSAFLSLYLAAAMALVARLGAGRGLSGALLFAAGWLLAELARAQLFTGFPWVASGYAHVDGPLAVLAPWTGVYGMGFVAAFIAALFAAFAGSSGSARLPLRRRAALPLAGVALLAVLGIAGPAQFTRESGSLQVSLLQTNVAQDEKFAAERMPQALGWLSAQLLAAPGDLVVAPETAIPLLPGQLEPAFWLPLKQRFESGGPAALIGLPLGSYEQGYTNSVVGLSAATAAPGEPYRYDKHHLVPFGEFIPFGFRWFTEMMNIPLGDFSRGPLAAPSFRVRGERVAPNICYEDLFGEELAARFADAAAAPTIFANMSNIAWFGDTVAIEQHLHISRLRALEFQRPMLRATNTGATAIIDHRGRVTRWLAPFTAGVLHGPVQGRDGLTPFARWASIAGLWPLWGLALALVGLAVALARRP